MIAVALYYSAVALPVRTVFKKIHLDKRANYYEALFTGVLYLKKTLSLKTEAPLLNHLHW